MVDIGRNDPCPCGSGKKYKNCCLAIRNQPLNNKPGPDYFNLHKLVAYRGAIGRRRQEFCRNYINNKQTNFKLVELEQNRRAAESGKSIFCRKGCRHCCSSSVQASLQECEAIVYYLYQHDEVLQSFLRRYPEWRQQLRQNGDIFKDCVELWQTEVTPENEQLIKQRYAEEVERYYRQDIPCPFLENDSCSIYEVRPYSCAALISLNAPEYCRPDSPIKSDYLMIYPAEISHEGSFYFNGFESSILSFMPLTVFEILKNGTYYLSQVVPGLEKLDREFRRDPEVSSIWHRHGSFQEPAVQIHPGP
jgi:Fe-S-cluster containining protein